MPPAPDGGRPPPPVPPADRPLDSDGGEPEAKSARSAPEPLEGVPWMVPPLGRGEGVPVAGGGREAGGDLLGQGAPGLADALVGARHPVLRLGEVRRARLVVLVP